MSSFDSTIIRLISIEKREKLKTQIKEKMFFTQVQFISIVTLLALTFPRHSFNMSIDESDSDTAAAYTDLNPKMGNILDVLQSQLNSDVHDSSMKTEIFVQLLTRLILQRIQESEEQIDY